MSDINKAMVANEVTMIKCPNPDCGHIFKPSWRCPECGQRVESAEERQRKLQERCDMVRAMETVCRNINDEEILMGWLIGGVADGDIDAETTDEFIIDQYCTDDEEFAELMDCFLRKMKSAYKSGGLYCGDVVSNIGDYTE